MKRDTKKIKEMGRDPKKNDRDSTKKGKRENF